jgi:hypothetical protein
MTIKPNKPSLKRKKNNQDNTQQKGYKTTIKPFKKIRTNLYAQHLLQKTRHQTTNRITAK